MENADRTEAAWLQVPAAAQKALESVRNEGGFSHRTLTGVPVRERKAMLAQKGALWDDLDQAVKQGTFIRRELHERTVSYFHKRKQETRTIDVQRREWTPVPAPWFDSLEVLMPGQG